MATFLQFFAAIILAYGLVGAVYCLRLWWPSIIERLSWLFAPLAVMAVWPAILWAEVEYAFKERKRQRAHSIPSKQYVIALARLTAEEQRRKCA